MAVQGTPIDAVPEALSVDYFIGLKEIAPGVRQSVKIQQVLVAGAGSSAEVNAVKDRVTATEGNITTLSGSLADISVQLPALQDGVSAAKYDTLVTLGGFAPTTVGVSYFTAAQIGATRAAVWNLPFAGIAKAIVVNCYEATTAVVQTLERRPNGLYRVTATANVPLAGGVQTVALPDLPFLVDGAVVIRNARIAFSAGHESNISFGGAMTAGSDYTMTLADSRLQMQVEVATSSKDFSEGRGVLSYPLTAIDDFSAVGTWTPSSLGVTPSGSGTERLRHRLPSCTDRCSTTVRVKLSAITNIVGLIRFPVEALAYGAIGEVDFGAATIKLYRWDGSTKTVDASAALTVPGVLGRTYVLELPKNRTTVSFSVTDTVTRQSQSVSFGPPAGSSDVGTRAWGYPGLWSVGSAATFSQFAHRVLVTKRPRLMLLGDSNTEAQSLGSDVIYRESNLLETSLGQTVVNAGRGGANERDMLARFRLDVWLWRPEWVRLLLGTNDRDVNNLEAWSNKMIDIIRYCQALGIKVIVGTLPPNATNQAFLTLCNNFILSGGFGADVRIVDYALGLSNGNDRITLNTSLMLGDSTHMNKPGHGVMAGQMKCDVPELWDA